MTDLRSRLHEVVDEPGLSAASPAARGATALDDVLIGVLTARVRRRRAVRTGATGTLSALAVAAVAVGAAALTDGAGEGDPTPAGPFEGVSGPVLRCGDDVAVETLRSEDQGLTLAAPELANSTVVAGEPLETTLAVAYDGLTTLEWDTEQYLQLAALRDGSVVAIGVTSLGPAIAPGRMTTDAAVTLSSCAPTGRLAAGGYELVAIIAFANADGIGTLEVSAGPVPFTVVPEPASPDEARRQAEAALAEVVAAAESARADTSVGSCGTRMPVATDPYLGLGIEVGPAARTGEPLYGTGAVTAGDGLTVVGDAPITGVQLVLTRDGVVVGRGEYDPAYVTRLTITGDRPLELPAVGDAVVCRLPGTDGPTLPLPAGTYQAYGLFQVAVSEVEAAGGGVPAGGAAVTGTRTAVSQPVDVVVGDATS